MQSKDLAALIGDGAFGIGCNYWASHAGTSMWTEWRPEVVDADFLRLQQHGIRTVRVFPLWSVFQPIDQLRGGGGFPREIRWGETPRTDDECGRAGVCATSMGRFAQLCALAEKHHLKLVVALLNGWMSGRFFAPPAIAHLNAITDPLSIQWQVRFISYFVKSMQNQAAIIAWEPGNECNCMGPVANVQQSWLWTATVTNAIRAADHTRPVFSGMHSVTIDGRHPWLITDQGELTDALTTHPYPIFTPHCGIDPVNTMRAGLHATAESRYYADISRQVCFAEELGTLGPMIADEATAADYISMNLWSLWANGCPGLFWWCASDQTHLEHAPYDWASCERELGLFRVDGSAKPVVLAMRDFAGILNQWGHKPLPERLIDAVCVLTEDQDHWGVAYSTFTLAKQAGFDVRFCYGSQDLPESPIYLLPSVAGCTSLSRRRVLQLLERVRAGAVLYLSCDDALLSPFDVLTGLRVVSREHKPGPTTLKFDAIEKGLTLSIDRKIRLNLAADAATPLATEADGALAMSVANVGKGRVVFLSAPLEKSLMDAPGVFLENAAPYWKLYRYIASLAPSTARIAQRSDTPQIGLTEHPIDADHRLAVLVNYSPRPQTTTLTLTAPWHIVRTFPESTGTLASPKASSTVEIAVAANRGLIVELAR